MIENILEKYNHKQELLINTLKLVNPLNILDKGYSLVEKDGRILNNTDTLAIEDTINIKLSKGELKAVVKEKKEWKI